MKVEGLCALVTGGASGIGKNLCERLLSKDAKFVAVVDMNKAAGEATEKEFKEKFGEEKVCFITCDVTNEEQVEGAFKEVVKGCGRLDLLVNNAGAFLRPNVIQVNLGGTIRCCQIAKKYMSKTFGGPGGLILNMCSLAGFIPFMDPIYCASKHGVFGYSLALAECDKDFSGADNIRIAIICPTGVDTPLLRNSPLSDSALSKVNFVPVDQVSDACIMAIEDDSTHACCIRITAAYGTDLLPMKSSKEWQKELKVFKM